MESKICPSCGSIMEEMVDGCAHNFKCKKCGYGEATTIATGIEWDSNEYAINLLENNLSSIENIKLISSICGENFIYCKYLLKNGGLLIKGKALEIKPIIDKLNKSLIKIKISPEFKY